MFETPFYQAFESALSRLQLRSGQQVVVALGGGVDSQSVLALANFFRQNHPEFRYLAIHLDHAFHEKSPEWAEFLRNECESMGFPSHVEPLLVPQGSRVSKEAAGRDARYQRMFELTEPDAVILLGQHRSDQAETFLLQLKRGAGPKGLSAMAQFSEGKEERTLVRPLLEFAKTEIYQFAEAHQLNWIEDDTNYDESIDRNFLRHSVMPLLEKRWSGIEKTIARSARLCAEHEALLKELLEVELRERISPEGYFDISGWNHISQLKQKALIRAWIELKHVTLPSSSILEELVTQLSRLPQGKVGVSWGQCRVVRVKKALHLKVSA